MRWNTLVRALFGGCHRHIRYDRHSEEWTEAARALVGSIWWREPADGSCGPNDGPARSSPSDDHDPRAAMSELVPSEIIEKLEQRHERLIEELDVLNERLEEALNSFVKPSGEMMNSEA